MSSIVDSDGHKRFVTGDISAQTISGVTFTYAKWSLSGTHLMFVLAGNTSITISASTLLANITLPGYIYNKIYQLKPQASNLVSLSEMQVRESVGSTATVSKCELYKVDSDSILKIFNFDPINTSATASGFRLQFDLLID